MRNDVLERLPSRHEIGREIVATSQRGRRLRSLYELIARIERERLEAEPTQPAPADDSEGNADG